MQPSPGDEFTVSFNGMKFHRVRILVVENAYTLVEILDEPSPYGGCNRKWMATAAFDPSVIVMQKDLEAIPQENRKAMTTEEEQAETLIKEMLRVELKVKRVPCADGSILPLIAYQSAGASGLDLYAREEVILRKMMPVRVPCGIELEIPPGYEGQVRPRSSRSMRGEWAAFGTIDCDYRGEVSACVLLLSSMYDFVKVEKAERIAQLVIAPVVQVTLREVAQLGGTARGSNGWGSTGR